MLRRNVHLVQLVLFGWLHLSDLCFAIMTARSLHLLFRCEATSMFPKHPNAVLEKLTPDGYCTHTQTCDYDALTREIQEARKGRISSACRRSFSKENGLLLHA